MGLLKNILFPSSIFPTIIKKAGKADLLKWQHLVMPSAPTKKLVLTADQLRAESSKQCSRRLKQLQESVELLQSTIKAETFFERIDFCHQLMEELKAHNHYLRMNEITECLKDANQIEVDSDSLHREFITRAMNEATKKAITMKTQKGRQGKIDRFMETMRPFYMILSENNRSYLQSLYAYSVQQISF